MIRKDRGLIWSATVSREVWQLSTRELCRQLQDVIFPLISLSSQILEEWAIILLGFFLPNLRLLHDREDIPASPPIANIIIADFTSLTNVSFLKNVPWYCKDWPVCSYRDSNILVVSCKLLNRLPDQFRSLQRVFSTQSSWTQADVVLHFLLWFLGFCCPMNQGRKTMGSAQGRFLVGGAWKQHSSHLPMNHGRALSQWPHLPIREYGKCNVIMYPGRKQDILVDN